MFSPTQPSALTLSGNLSQARALRIGINVAGTIASGGKFWYSLGDENGALEYRVSNVALASSVALGSSGMLANFADVSYAAADTFNSVTKSWTPIVGANGVLDNFTVTASPGTVYEAHSLQASYDRASVLMAPAMLGNQSPGGPASVISGGSFTMLVYGELIALPASSTLALFGFTPSTGTTNKSIVDYLVSPASGAQTPPVTAWGCQRIDSTPTAAQRYNSDGLSGGFAAAHADLSPHVHAIRFDQSISTVDLSCDGFTYARGSWTGPVAADRMTIGGVRVGTLAATAFASGRVGTILIYDYYVPDSEFSNILVRI